MDSKPPLFSAGASILLALMLLVLPLQWILAAVTAALFHEGCHYIAIRLCSRERTNVRFFAYGARMPLPNMSRGKELLCALAGPIGGLLLLSTAQWLPRVAICAGFQSLYNLLPVYPMDGGRAVSCLMYLLLPPPRARKACAIVEALCLSGLVILGGYGFFVRKLGPLPLLFAVFLVLRLKKPCKVAAERVQ